MGDFFSPFISFSRRNKINLLTSLERLSQGCQMVYFQTKNPNSGQFWRAFDGKMWIYFIATWLGYFSDI
jgi:hypothetical protein